MISEFIAENATGLILLALRLGLTLALYAFLAYAVRVIWRDLRQQTRADSLSPIPPIYLKPESASEEIVFKLNQITIGRSPGCDLHIQDETVSALHVRLYFRQNQWWVEDNDSSNGTTLNSIPVETPTVLTSGDQLMLGNIGIRVNFKQ